MPQRPAMTLAIVTMLLSMSAAFAEESEQAGLKRHGRALAERMCAPCHAIGERGSSPHRAAPSFRNLSRRVELDRFAFRLRDGLTSGHPDMPTFRFTREDARALTAYLRSIQAH
jgi:mono/diheme cytochrome c family protein